MPGIIPVLEQLLQQSTTTKYAYLCHPCVHHVSRLKREGSNPNPVIQYLNPNTRLANALSKGASAGTAPSR